MFKGLSRTSLLFVFLLFILAPEELFGLINNCAEIIKVQNLQPSYVEISKFLQEFRAEHDEISSETWMRFFIQIREINFNSESSPLVRIEPQNAGGKERSLIIDPMLIEGWKKLGFISADGKFRFDIIRSEVARRFQDLTGMQVVFDVKPVIVNSASISESSASILERHQKYISDFLEGKVHFVKLHDAIFHAPWFLDNVRRDLFRLAARYDLQTKSSGPKSVLSALFEYAAHSHLIFLRGPFQLINESTEDYTPGNYKPFPDFHLQKIEDLKSYPYLYQGFLNGYIKYVWKLGVEENERISWWGACLVMAVDLEWRYSENKSEWHPESPAYQLYSDLKDMLRILLHIGSIES